MHVYLVICMEIRREITKKPQPVTLLRLEAGYETGVPILKLPCTALLSV